MRADVVERVLTRYGVSRPDARRSVFLPLCIDAMTRVLQWDSGRIPDGKRQVAGVANPLGLSPADLSHAERGAALSRVRAKINEALSDHTFSGVERAELRAISEALGIGQAEIDELVRTEIQPILSGALEAALADRRYTPKEEASLTQLAASLGVTLSQDAAATAATQRCRLLWEIENGRLPEIAAPITLQRQEVCHFACDCSWRELRTRTVRVNYSGPTASIRIMKGVYWRMGSIAPKQVTETDLVEVTRGTLYVTNKRLLLDGANGNKAVTWRAVFGQELYSDAIKLEKASGKDPYLFVAPSDIEVASTVIAGAMAAAE